MAKKTIYYVGKEKVKKFVVAVNTDLVGVLYENGKNEDFTSEQWAGVRDEKPYEDGLIAVRKHEKMLQRILKEMVESRITIGDHSWVLEQISNIIGANYKKALAKVFKVDFPEKIMLFHIDETLKK